MLRKRLFQSKIYKKLAIGIMLLAVCAGLFAAARPAIDEFLQPFGRSPFVLVLRDLAVATYAHIKAGDNVPFEMVYSIDALDDDDTGMERIDYARSGQIDLLDTWGIETNSVWIADLTRMVLPFVAYEGIRPYPVLPKMVVIWPYGEDESFHILGQAYTNNGVILLNERFFLEAGYRDLRQVLSTVVHEIIHHQKGVFSYGQAWVFSGAGNIEANTQAATIEVLAGMCHYRDELACKAFWSEIEGYARGSLLMRLRVYGYEDWYDKIADLLWRTSEDTLRRDKSLRHWMLDDDLKDYYYEIVNNYQKVPWETLVIKGICGTDLDTGFDVETTASQGSQTSTFDVYEDVMMTFDDTQSMFGDVLSDLLCRLPDR